jgi:hypothetical protein
MSMMTRIVKRAGAVAGIVLLSACSTVAPIDPNNDALRLECHWDLKYPGVAPLDAGVEQLREAATRRLAALQLNAVWTLEQDGVTAEAFTDSPEDRARLQRLLSVVLPGLERYTPVFFANVRLKNIVLVKELAVGGQRRLAMPMAETDGVAYADNNAKTLCPAGMEMRVPRVQRLLPCRSGVAGDESGRAAIRQRRRHLLWQEFARSWPRAGRAGQHVFRLWTGGRQGGNVRLDDDAGLCGAAGFVCDEGPAAGGQGAVHAGAVAQI